MLKRLLRKLLGNSHSKRYGPHYGGGYYKHSSSDHYHRPPPYGQPPRHNQYGHGYYKKKGYSSHSS